MHSSRKETPFKMELGDEESLPPNVLSYGKKVVLEDVVGKGWPCDPAMEMDTCLQMKGILLEVYIFWEWRRSIFLFYTDEPKFGKGQYFCSFIMPHSSCQVFSLHIFHLLLPIHTPIILAFDF